MTIAATRMTATSRRKARQPVSFRRLGRARFRSDASTAESPSDAESRSAGAVPWRASGASCSVMSPLGSVTAYVARRLPQRDSRDLGVALLLDLRLLAAKVAQVVKLRAAHVTAGDDLDVIDDRGVHGEHALDTDLERDLAHREGLTDALVLAGDHDALEHLNTRARAFDDVHVHLDGVTGAEVGDVRPERSGVDVVEDVHGNSLSAT